MELKSFNSVIEFMEAFPTEQACIEYCEKCRWKNGVISPYDKTSQVYVYSKGKYRCKNTKRDFNVRTGTMFQNSKISLKKWFYAIWIDSAHKKGISSCQLARDIDVTQKTAWNMLRDIRQVFSVENTYKLSGEIELDETFVGGKNKNRHYDKKVKNSQGRSFKDKTPVLGMLERGGKVVCKVVKDTSKKELTPQILNTIKENAVLFTDEWCGYDDVGKIYTREIVDHGKGQYVNGNAYTNTIEGFWSIVKRSIFGIYHHTSRKYLQYYMNEYVFRYNTRNLKDGDRFCLFLENICNTA